MAAAVLGLAVACHPSKTYESDVEITRVAALRTDGAGEAITVEVEIAYLACPGAEREVVRGDAAFAACMKRHVVGDALGASITHEWGAGQYKRVIRKLGECRRAPVPSDDAPYTIVRECDDRNASGSRTKFACKSTPGDAVVTKCPWLRRR